MIVNYRDPLDSTSDGAFETDSAGHLYFSINGVKKQLDQADVEILLAQLNELVALLTLELVEQGWNIKSPKLYSFLSNSLSNIQQ